MLPTLYNLRKTLLHELEDSICGDIFTKKTMSNVVGRLSSMKPTSLEHRFKIRPEDK